MRYREGYIEREIYMERRIKRWREKYRGRGGQGYVERDRYMERRIKRWREI